MKVNLRILSLLIAIAVGIFWFFFVFPVGSAGKQNTISLPAPPGTAAVIYLNRTAYPIVSPNPAKVEQALKESQHHWWIDAGKKISGASLVAAAFFSGLAMRAPLASVPEPRIMALILTGKLGATGLSYICSAVAAGVGVSVIWMDAKTPKLTWEEAKFCALFSRENSQVVKFPDGNIGVMTVEGKLERWFIVETEKFLVVSREETGLPYHTLLDGQILYFRQKPILPSRELKRGETLKINEEILVIY